MRIFSVVVAAIVCIHAEAQRKDGKMVMVKPPKGAVCYASTVNEFTTINAPNRPNANAKVGGANIEVTYDGFTTQAKAAFEAAVQIWEGILESPVTIKVYAQWEPLGPGVLGSAGPNLYIANFDGAPKKDVLYPVAVAEKIAGVDLNDPNDYDIVASFNSTNSQWHYGLTGSNPPADTYDLLSIVLHEIGHGLGITHGYAVQGTVGYIPDYFGGRPVVYETNIVNSSGNNMVNDFTPPSTALKTLMTNSLLFSSPLVRSVNSNNNATLYAPATYSAGSSIAHVDENAYPAGNANSLMTPFIGSAERILDPGPIVKNILNEIGWTVTTLEHEPLRGTEDTSGPYHVVATVENSNGYDAGSITLNYKTTGSFTEVEMTPTGNDNEFEGDIPGGSAGTYSYYLSVVDDDNRTFTNPGSIIKPGSAPQQGVFAFEVGPDTKAPVINHTPKEFITTKADLDLQAIVSDNIGVDNVKVEWKLNDVDQPDQFMALVPDTDSTYAVVIVLTDLQADDKIEYRIRAEDSSVAGNVSFKPSESTYYEVNVVGLGDTQDSYTNDFNALSADDFFGDGFTVSKPSGFDDGAIHSDHPYTAGGAEGASVELIYNLKIPIRIADDAADATMKFDEIVLVEPGENGIAWPAEDFFDYVVVEGSVDGGVNWVAVADGYDSRLNTDWLNRWNSSISQNNSTATGIPSLYHTHTFNLHDKFQPGDEVAFRFRLFSDPFSFGWGWSIDNLRIQIDDTPPTIKHQHVDYVMSDAGSVLLETNITDSKGIQQIFFDYNVNGGETNTTEIVVVPGNDAYTQTINLATLGLEAGDEFQYSFRAVDNSGNEGSFPSTGLIKTAIISMSTSVDLLTADFSAESPELTGNFVELYSSGLSSSGFGSIHPYDVGLGIDGVSEFSWLTKKPVKVSADNPLIYYEDIALVEYSGNDVKDYVVVEASKDGITWEPLVGPYAANSVGLWKSTFDVTANPTQTLYESHTVDITESGAFQAGDVILIRFRLHSDAETSGWGWIVDNLSIQGSVTGVESTTVDAVFDAWPNPVTNGALNLSLTLPSPTDVNVEIFSTQGQVLTSERFSAPAGDVSRSIEVSSWPAGFYVVRVRSEFGTAVKKIIKLNSRN